FIIYVLEHYDEVNLHVDCSISHPNRVNRIYIHTKDDNYIGTLYPDDEISNIKIGKNNFENYIDNNLLKIKWSVSHQGTPESVIPPEFNISIDQIYIRLI
ncbi:MAG: hypothetical protein NUK54_09835, partial [Methanothrix sp.]|nr:hypothetical protein [Methanothrix sp.]